MHIKRALSLIVSALIVFSFGACASPAVSTDVTGESSDTAAAKRSQYEEIYREREDSLPENLDFGGETVNILCLNNGYYENEIAVEDLISDPLNDAIYIRNLEVSERLNVELVAQTASGTDDNRSLLLKTVSSGDDCYQIYAEGAQSVLQDAMDGYFCNLCDLPNSYMELDAPWYSQDYLEQICTEDKIFGITGALSLSMLRSVHVTYFNKKVMEDYHIPDVYDIVNSGDWTIDKELELTGGLYNDLNGNSEADNEDFYGFRSSITWGNDGYWVSFDINFMSRDADNNFYFDLETEKLSNALVKINRLLWESQGTCTVEHEDKTNMEAFVSGRAFMVMSNIGYAEKELLRNMTDEYGIIPLPKYDADQKGYYSNPTEVYQMFAIPVTVKNPDMVTAVLEAMFAESWRKVVPIYSDVVLKGKYMNDPESRKMFDLILDSIRFEPALHYNYALMEIPDLLLSYRIIDKSSDISSVLAKYTRVMDLLLENLNQALR